MDSHRFAAVAKVPGLISLVRSECPHFECQRIADFDIKGRCVARMNRRRQFYSFIPIQYLHDGKVVVHVSLLIEDLEDFAVASGLLVHSWDSCPVGGGAVAK